MPDFKNILNGNRPFVYLLIYDAKTQRTTCKLGDSPIPSQVVDIENILTLKTLSELNYYYNALIDNVGKANVGMSWKEDENDNLRYLYIGMGLEGVVIGTDGLPTGNTNDMIEFQAGTLVNGVVINLNTDPPVIPVCASPVGSVFLPKDTGLTYYYEAKKALYDGFYISQFDNNGNNIKSEYCKSLSDTVTILANTKRVFFDVQPCFIDSNSADAFVFAGTDAANLIYLTGNNIGIQYEKNYLGFVFFSATNKDVRFYQKGVLVQTVLNAAPNSPIVINPAAEFFDYIKMVDAAQPAPPPPAANQVVVWNYQRGTLDGSLRVDQNAGTVAQTTPGAISQTGKFVVNTGDSIDIFSTSSDKVRLIVRNETDNVVLSDQDLSANANYSFVTVAGKSYSINATTHS